MVLQSLQNCVYSGDAIPCTVGCHNFFEEIQLLGHETVFSYNNNCKYLLAPEWL